MSQATSGSSTAFQCPRCHTWLYNGTLACPACGGLVYAHQLFQLSSEAQKQEQTNPFAAAQLWQQTLPMLPPNSQQYQMVRDRIAMLLSGIGMPVVAQMTTAPTTGASAPVAAREPDTWARAVTKTAVSMLISILIYAMVPLNVPGRPAGLAFATGFVVLILVHELGHVLAMRRYRLRASAPIFIPFLGAVINLRDRPKDAWQEAVVGIGGPLLGTIGTLACFLFYLQTGSRLALDLSCWGFVLNLFNLLPVPPLDGGRVTAAVSTWIWVPGLLFLPAWIGYEWMVHHRLHVILILLLLIAWPRVKQTIFGDARNSPYYDIPVRLKRTMGIAYVALGLALLGLFLYTRSLAPLFPI
jgi:Zn-dependent protease